jgi:hypothetical protein
VKNKTVTNIIFYFFVGPEEDIQHADVVFARVLKTVSHGRIHGAKMGGNGVGVEPRLWVKLGAWGRLGTWAVDFHRGTGGGGVGGFSIMHKGPPL